MFIKMLMKLSLINTIRFNWRYFSPLHSKCGSWKMLFRMPVLLSKNVKIKCLKGTVSVTSGERVTIGFGRIDDFDFKYERAIWNNNGEIVFKGKCHLGHGTRINNHGTIIFGSNFSISANSIIDCDCSIVFGDDVLLSWDVFIMDHDTHSINDVEGRRINVDKPIKIGNGVWICCRCTILKGAEVPDGCVLAAGSRISSKCCNENAIIGDFGKIISTDILWHS